jgi:asparagine synthetase B (glutamine-hydrolysing)
MCAADGIGLGNRRLAIIDRTEAGSQPMSNEDGTIRVTFNGEIYNHRELRTKHRLEIASSCDGAILPELWRRLGTGKFAELRGMWSIAVWDAGPAELTLAMDGFGIKPLYWTRSASGEIVFASKVRPLLHHGRQALRLKRAALTEYLTFGAMHSGESGLTDIHAVPPNSWRTFEGGVLRPSGSVHAIRFPLENTSQSLHEAFVESVERHVMSDVPIALSLSSGLDSACLAWALRTKTPMPGDGDRSARALSLAEFDRYLESTLLPDADGFSMASSVEMRVPYVDLPFARVARNSRGRWGISKCGFATALGDPLLESIARGPKRGFTLPMDSWMRSGVLRSEVTALRSGSRLLQAILAPEGIDSVLRKWEQRPRSWTGWWLLVVLDGWLRSLPYEVTVDE